MSPVTHNFNPPKWIFEYSRSSKDFASTFRVASEIDKLLRSANIYQLVLIPPPCCYASFDNMFELQSYLAKVEICLTFSVQHILSAKNTLSSQECAAAYQFSYNHQEKGAITIKLGNRRTCCLRYYD